MPKLRPALAIVALALLAACNKSADKNASASGQVLQGTISDDMLPLDKLTSEAPLAEPTAAATGKAGKTGKSGGAAANPAAADSATPAPGATPTPESSASAEPDTAQ